MLINRLYSRKKSHLPLNYELSACFLLVPQNRMFWYLSAPIFFTSVSKKASIPLLSSYCPRKEQSVLNLLQKSEWARISLRFFFLGANIRVSDHQLKHPSIFLRFLLTENPKHRCSIFFLPLPHGLICLCFFGNGRITGPMTCTAASIRRCERPNAESPMIPSPAMAWRHGA